MFERDVRNVLEGGIDWPIHPPLTKSTFPAVDTPVAASCAKAEAAHRSLINELKELTILWTDALLALQKAYSDYTSQMDKLEVKQIQLYQQNHHLLETRRALLKEQESQDVRYIDGLQEMSMVPFNNLGRFRNIATYDLQRRRYIEGTQYELQAITAMLKRMEEENETIDAENDALLAALLARRRENDPELFPGWRNGFCTAVDARRPWEMSEGNFQREGDGGAEWWQGLLRRKLESLALTERGIEAQKSNDKGKGVAMSSERLAGGKMGPRAGRGAASRAE